MPTRLRSLIGGLCAAVLAAGPVAAAAAPTPSATPPGEGRDMLLMLEGGPVHLRLWIALDGRSLPEAREAYIDRLIATLDADGDGKISRKESRNSPLLTTPRRAADNAFLAQLEENRTVERDEILRSVERVGGETVVYRQDETAADNDLEVFKFLDGDGSGLIDRQEMVQAAGKIASRDSDRDECVSFREFLPEPEVQPDMFNVVAVMTPDPERPKPIVADLLRDTSEPLLPRRLVRQYDRNRDGKLSAGELGWSEDRVRLIDRSRDGKLDPAELADVHKTPVDLEAVVELGQSGGAEPRLRILAVAGERGDRGERPDFARLVFPRAIVTVSLRQIDPIASAIDNALREFNRMDLDANGYLDEMETSERIRFARGLFTAIDADSDGKIFAEEMQEYVRLRAEPAATSCQVNIYDTGFGFFQTLDRNGDGRISMREMRTAPQALSSMIRSRRDAVAPTDPVRHFHIELVRGSYQLFGRNEQMIAQSPSFVELAPIGPIWFQRMDRNSDGDLTWNEFLGPRDVFYRLDTDHDGLIDPTEAEAAGGPESSSQ